MKFAQKAHPKNILSGTYSELRKGWRNIYNILLRVHSIHGTVFFSHPVKS